MTHKLNLLMPALLFAALLSSCSKDKDNIWDKQGAQKPQGITETEQKKFEELTQGRKLKVITLPNQLQVALISDPGAATSSASMDVGVGELSNPLEYRGMAHYLEHMLFLGTSKFPEPGSFSKFLEKNGGQFNAYTSDENTNYFFTINNSTFDQALDMFSGFFIEPTFNPTFVPKEIVNVDSEYQKNREDSYWRYRYLDYYLSDEGSPLHREFQGSTETLGNVPRDVLLAFYKKYYSANQMKLALISPLPLEKQEELVRARFSAVPNSNAPKVDLSGQPMKATHVPNLVEFKAADGARSLVIAFELPSDISYVDSKPLSMITQNLGYWGPGSLDAKLKKEGLIEKYQSDIQRRSYGTEYRLFIELTEKGAADYKSVVKSYFSLLKQLKIHGLKKEIFDDAAQMAKLSYIYGSPARGTNVKAYTDHMRKFGAQNIEGNMSLYSKYDAEAFQKYISLLTPERASIFFSSPESSGTSKADFYDIEYTETKLSGDPWLKELQEVPAGNFVLLEKNPFVTNDTTLVDKAGRAPKRLLSNEFGELWVSPAKAPIPKAHIELVLVKAEQQGMSKAHEAAVSELYKAAQDKMLGEWGDNAATAGISSKLGGSRKVLTLSIEGFSEKLGAFTVDLVGQLKKFSLSEEDFAVLRASLEAGVEESKRKAAYERVGELFAGLIRPGSVELEEYAPELSKVTLAELHKYAAEVAQKSRLEMKVFGNVSDEGAKSLFQNVAASFGLVPQPPESRKSYVVEVNVPAGKQLSLVKAGETNNNVWYSAYQMGPSTPETIAMAQIANVIVGDPFYAEMRMKRSLGYIVSARTLMSSLSPWLRFMIQSNKTTDELQQIALPWINSQVAVAQEMSEAEFADLKRAIVESLRNPLDNFKAEVESFESAVDLYDGNFDYQETIAKAIERTTKAEFVAALTKTLDAASARKVSIYFSARGLPLAEAKGETKVSNSGELHQQVPSITKPLRP